MGVLAHPGLMNCRRQRRPALGGAARAYSKRGRPCAVGCARSAAHAHHRSSLPSASRRAPLLAPTPPPSTSSWVQLLMMPAFDRFGARPFVRLRVRFADAGGTGAGRREGRRCVLLRTHNYVVCTSIHVAETADSHSTGEHAARRAIGDAIRVVVPLVDTLA